MSNVIPIHGRASSARPTNLFLLTKCVELFDVLDAAILADIYYWIAQGDEPWRKAQDHADLFAVNEKTIRLHSIKLAEKYGCFGRRDSMLKNGKKGACKYFPAKTANSKSLKDQYYALFNRGFKQTDFGEFMAEEVTEVPKYITLPVAYIERLKDINIAYLLARLHWITFAEDPNPVFRFKTINKMAKAMLLNRNTLMRYLDFLQKYNHLTFTKQDDGIVISINENSDLYEQLRDWISDNQSGREDKIMNGDF